VASGGVGAGSVAVGSVETKVKGNETILLNRSFNFKEKQSNNKVTSDTNITYICFTKFKKTNSRQNWNWV
jgi:alpha-acetolactate decarboxylase